MKSASLILLFFIGITGSYSQTINLSCSDTLIYLDSNGAYNIDTSFLVDTATSTAGVDSVWLSKANLSCTDLGVDTIWSYLLDSNSNIDSCQSLVAVQDSILPFINCHDTTIYLNSSGSFVIDTSYVFDSVWDNCGILTVQLLDSAFNCSSLGINLARVVAIDNYNNRDTGIAQVTVIDTINPSILCHDTIVYLNGLGQFVFDTSYIITSLFDNCSIDSVWLSDTSVTCLNDTLDVTIYARDLTGNIDSCIAQVLVIDSTGPNIFCKDTVVILDSNGQFIIDTSFTLVSVNDNCNLDSVWLNDSVLSCFSDSLFWVYASDIYGNIDSCQFTVTILDTISPSISCNDSNLYLPLSGVLTIDTSHVVQNIIENCMIDSIWLSLNSLTCSNIGLNPIWVYVQDQAGNQDSCLSNITLIDTLPPIALCQNMNAFLDASGNVAIDSNYVDGGSYGNCLIDSMYLLPNSFNCANVGANNVMFYIRDNQGFWDSCLSIVSVLDTISPVAICTDTTVYILAGSAVIDSTFVDLGSSDNCGIDLINLSQASFTCADVGVNTIIVTVIDSSGNFSTCTSNVTVADSIAPLASCRDTTIYLDATGVAMIDSLLIDNGSSDDCGYSVSFNQNTFLCSDIGVNQVWMYVTDLYGNIDSCQSNVTVLDTIKPTSIGQNITVYLDTSGQTSISTTDIDNGSNDNCSISSLVIDQSSFDCSQIGNNTVTLVASDLSGNVDSSLVTVTVLDTVRPIVSCSTIADTSVIDINCLFTVADYTSLAIVDDNCGIAGISITQNPAPWTTLSGISGSVPIRIIATDMHGNIDSCEFNLTVNCDQKLRVPQLITPNNDGFNDSWDIPELLNYPNNYVQVFNKWGVLVFDKHGYSSGWKGKANITNRPVTGNGRGFLPSGTYYYIIDLGDGYGVEKGYIQLML